MNTYIALLRGINVSGSNLIKMDALKSCMETLGFMLVRTYIQSGNLVFNYQEIPNTGLESKIGDTILTDFGCRVPVMVKSSIEIKKIITNNPFICERMTPIDTLHITFLSGMPDSGLLSNILPLKNGVDEGIVLEDIIYLNCPQGYGRTKFTNTYFEKKLKLSATTRNWNTIFRLDEMAEEKTPIRTVNE